MESYETLKLAVAGTLRDFTGLVSTTYWCCLTDSNQRSNQL